MKKLVTLALLALAGGTSAALADASTVVPGRSCFLITQFENWKAPDDRTIFIRINTNRFYRLDLVSSCPALKFPDAFLITKTRGPSTVCSAIDWDLRVGQSGEGRFASPCIVKTMTPMTADEVSAIPKKFKP
jgi:hypothetical protein